MLLALLLKQSGLFLRNCLFFAMTDIIDGKNLTQLLLFLIIITPTAGISK
jgi:hypothetical protein